MENHPGELQQPGAAHLERHGHGRRMRGMALHMVLRAAMTGRGSLVSMDLGAGGWLISWFTYGVSWNLWLILWFAYGVSPVIE